MKIEIDCIPCLSRQALTALRMLNLSKDRELDILREVLNFSETVPLDDAPPAAPADKVHRMIRNLTNEADPFKKIKKEYNAQALRFESELWREINDSKDSTYAAIRFSIIGNVMDFGVHSQKFVLKEKVDKLMKMPLAIDAYERFQMSFKMKKGVFIILDNAGEIVFDKQLVRTFKNLGKEVVCAVKGGPVINDALIADAQDTELDKYCRVIENGNDYVGTVLQKCSPEFLSYFYSDEFLVISKGQANFETLNEEKMEIFFLFQAKCDVLARALSVPLNSLIFHSI